MDIFLSDLADQTSDESDVLSQEDSTELTAFLFPAVGALLMLLFGGLLFSSGTTLCKNNTMQENKIRKFEQKYGRRTIRFHNVPDKIAQEPLSVLQQENNDVVDALKKKYQELPQYQPISGVASNIVGLHGQTCAINISQQEVTHIEPSPIHCLKKDHDSNYENPICEVQKKEISADGSVGHLEARKGNKFSATPQNKNCASDHHGITAVTRVGSGGTHPPTSCESDSLEEFPRTECEGLTSDFDETVMPPNSRGIGLPPENTLPLFTSTVNRRVERGPCLSVLQCQHAPSDICVEGCNCPLYQVNSLKGDKTEIGTLQAKEEMAELLTWRDVAINDKRNLIRDSFHTCARENTGRHIAAAPSALGSLTVENMLQRGSSSFRQENLEKWLEDVERHRAFGGETRTQKYNSDSRTIELKSTVKKERSNIDEESLNRKAIPGRRKMKAPIQETLYLLKRLQLVSDDDLQAVQNNSPVRKGGRLSCLQTVRAPSSLCLCGDACGVHNGVEESSDRSSTRAMMIRDPTEAITTNNASNMNMNHETRLVTKGGRQSCLTTVRASSGICIHGSSCNVHCQRSKTISASDGTKNQNQDEKDDNFTHKVHRSRFRKVGSLDNNDLLSCKGHGASTFALGWFDLSNECNDNEIRGASSFGGMRALSVDDRTLRGASCFAEEYPEESDADYRQPITIPEDTRSASCFASTLNEQSDAGTSSVTLSIAMESDPETVLTNKFSNNQSIDSKTTVNIAVAKDKDKDKQKGIAKVQCSTIKEQEPNLESFCDKSRRSGADVNNNGKPCHSLMHAEHKERSQRAEVIKQNSHSTPKIPVQQERQVSDDRILKVGKCATLMSSLLNALQREEREKRNHNSTAIDKTSISPTNEPSVGDLKCSVFYKGAQSSNPMLYVTIQGLENISQEILNPEKSSIYVKVCLSPKSTTWRRTKTLHGSEKLSFKDHFIMSGVKPSDLNDAKLRFAVVSVAKEETVIGQLEIPLMELESREKLKGTYSLRAPPTKTDGIDIKKA